MARILLVDDDPAIRAVLSRALSMRGHAVACERGGFQALKSVVREPPDVVLLDLGLPDIDGFKVLKMVRATTDVPIIVITAHEDDAEMVDALNAGADDVIIKPFGANNLEARIRAVLRRSGSVRADDPVTVGDLVIDPRSRTVTLEGNLLKLSRKEFDLLLLLGQRVGEVVSRRQILAQVWQQAEGVDDRTIDVHLTWLRRKLGETAATPRYLHYTRGVGVRLVGPRVPRDGSEREIG
ncbi:MAG TPA: response regulator transcription factor [Kineosporiaceae bacterium]|nr:response regulator transcription factor [Kineosporiaceae bacterium]